jgi:glycosyltransferase involved in cell wall biosynthesis
VRIGIDVRSLQNDSAQRGIGTYTRELVKGLLSRGAQHEYVLFAFSNRPLPLFEQASIRRVTSSRKHFMWLSGQILFPLAAKRERLDLFYSPENIVPVLARCATAITVHDFINSDYPVYWKRSVPLRKAYMHLKNRTLRHADGIIAVSEYTRKKIAELVGVDMRRVKVIHEAAGKEFFPLSDLQRFTLLRRKYSIEGRFFLYVGAVDYHKNIDGLISAFAQLRDKRSRLVLAGVRRDPVYNDLVLGLARRFGVAERVHFLGYVAQDELVCLYNMAEGFVSVSQYEGFGLPCLEAMSCACPVIVSGNTSMREVAGGAGLLVDPGDTGQIAAAMDTVLGDTAAAAGLASAALQRSREFTWEKAAAQTLEFFEGMVG